MHCSFRFISLVHVAILNEIKTFFSGEGYLYDSSTVTITILDINDNKPTFIRPLFTGGKKTNGY